MVKVRPYRKSKKGGYEVDIQVRQANGEFYRERRKAPGSSESAARRWGEQREAHLVRYGCPDPNKKEVPTLEEFADRFLKEYSEANRLKFSTVVTQRSIIETHLKPVLGKKRLDQIGNADVQTLRGHLTHRNPKTVNNVVGVLSKMIRTALDWGVIEKVGFRVKPLKAGTDEMKFYEDSEFERLVIASAKVNAQAELITLLGGEAGLRAGEMQGLEWSDIDFDRRLMNVQRSVWCGVVGTPKGGRSRRVPMTVRLTAALKGVRHLRGERVLVLPAHESNMKALKWIRSQMKSAQRLAGLEATGGVHILRHTFCSRLAMRGRSVLEIQKLAGHANLTTTMRYMHLAPSVLMSAIGSLERAVRTDSGEIAEKVAKSEGAPEGAPVATGA